MKFKKAFLLLIPILLFSCSSMPLNDKIVYEDSEFLISDTTIFLSNHNISDLKSFDTHPEYIEPMLQGLFQKNGIELSTENSAKPNLDIEVSNKRIIEGLNTFYARSIVLRVHKDGQVIYQITYTDQKKKSLDSYYELYALLNKQISNLSKLIESHLKE